MTTTTVLPQTSTNSTDGLLWEAGVGSWRMSQRRNCLAKTTLKLSICYFFLHSKNYSMNCTLLRPNPLPPAPRRLQWLTEMYPPRVRFSRNVSLIINLITIIFILRQFVTVPTLLIIQYNKNNQNNYKIKTTRTFTK